MSAALRHSRNRAHSVRVLSVPLDYRSGRFRSQCIYMCKQTSGARGHAEPLPAQSNNNIISDICQPICLSLTLLACLPLVDIHTTSTSRFTRCTRALDGVSSEIADRYCCPAFFSVASKKKKKREKERVKKKHLDLSR